MILELDVVNIELYDTVNGQEIEIEYQDERGKYYYIYISGEDLIKLKNFLYENIKD